MSAGISGTCLITGASGQVGSACVRLLATEVPGISVIAPGRIELNLLSPESIRSAVRSAQPRWIISCAAYTAVDAAERDHDAAYAINAVAPGVLAEEAAAVNAVLIHLSTDYVFDGSGTRPWLETDPTSPLSVYGASKLAGEQAITAVAERTGLAHLVLRTSWVYSSNGKNFVLTMQRLLTTRTEPLRVVADQHGAPTSAIDLASAILQVIRVAVDASPESFSSRYSGLYHCTNSGDTTWYGLANAVREYLRMTRASDPPEIVPVDTAEYPTPAKRPHNSRLNCNKLAHTFGIRLPHWSTSVVQALRVTPALDT